MLKVHWDVECRKCSEFVIKKDYYICRFCETRHPNSVQAGALDRIKPGEQMESLVKKAFKTRLKADTSIGVSDLMYPFKVYFEKNDGCRDILKLLQCPSDMDWKSVPQHRWLVKNKVLFIQLLEVAPNTVITSRKLKEALSRIHEEKSINFSKKDNADLWDWVDTKVRIGCAQLRELKSSTVVWDRCMKRCTDEEKDVLKAMMDKIQLANCGGGSDNSQEIVDHKDSSCCTALVSLESGSLLRTPDAPRTSGGVNTNTRCGKEGFTSSSGQGTMLSSPQDVFASILSKKHRKKKKEHQTSSSMEATPEKNAPSAASTTVRKRLTYEEMDSPTRSGQEEELHGSARHSSKETGGSLIILPAGRKIINSRKKEESAQTTGKQTSKKRQVEDDSVNSSQEGPFLSKLLDAAVQDDEDDDEKERPTADTKGDRKKKKKKDEEETHATSKMKTDKNATKKEPPKDGNALNEVGSGLTDSASLLRVCMWRVSSCYVCVCVKGFEELLRDF